LGCCVVVWLLIENSWVSLLKFGQHFLAVLDLHQRRLERLDRIQDFFPEQVITNNEQSFLEDIVAKLVVNQFLNYEVHPILKILGLVGFEPQFLDYLVVVIWKRAFENLVNVRLLP